MRGPRTFSVGAAASIPGVSFEEPVTVGVRFLSGVSTGRPMFGRFWTDCNQSREFLRRGLPPDSKFGGSYRRQ
jgi:hypothetical protein